MRGLARPHLLLCTVFLVAFAWFSTAATFAPRGFRRSESDSRVGQLGLSPPRQAAEAASGWSESDSDVGFSYPYWYRPRRRIPGKPSPGGDWRGADLRRANLRGMDLREVDFRGADLRGANLSGARLDHTWMNGADLRGARFWRAEYDPRTTWPKGFDPRVHGARELDWYGRLVR